MKQIAARETALRVERWLARAMRSEDPVACLARAANDRRLPQSVRDGFAHADPSGVRLSALFVARLRFERLIQASAIAGDLYAADPARFAETFRAYHRAVPIRAIFPADEARAFAAWVRRLGFEPR